MGEGTQKLKRRKIFFLKKKRKTKRPEDRNPKKTTLEKSSKPGNLRKQRLKKPKETNI